MHCSHLILLPPDSKETANVVTLVVQSDGPVREKAKWRGAGLAVPVFSLRTSSSVGSGEYVDLRPLVDLCAATGKSISQSQYQVALAT